MNINYDSAVVITQNIEQLKTFYHEILNQPIKYDFGNCITFEGGFSIWQLKDAYPISKALGAKYNKKGNNNLELCFVSDDLTEACAKLEECGVSFLHAIQEENWGQRTIRFYDPENNLVEIGESLKGFSLRLYNSGMSIAAVSKKTGIHEELIESFVNRQ